LSAFFHNSGHSVAGRSIPRVYEWRAHPSVFGALDRWSVSDDVDVSERRDWKQFQLSPGTLAEGERSVRMVQWHVREATFERTTFARSRPQREREIWAKMALLATYPDLT